jgi:hypothetical protein
VGDATVADALMDRLVHHAYRLELKGESMRKARAAPTAKRELLRILHPTRKAKVPSWAGRPPPNGAPGATLLTASWGSELGQQRRYSHWGPVFRPTTRPGNLLTFGKRRWRA